MTQDYTSNSIKTKIFVTGATGLVGSHLIKRLVTHDKKIKALYRSEIPFADEHIEWIKGDIFDIILLEEILTDVDEAYHCAGKVADPGHST